MNGYFLAEAATSRHAELLRTARDRRLAREARPTQSAAGSSGRTRRVVLDSLRAPGAALRAFVDHGWIAPPAAMVEGKAPGDGRGAVDANLAFGPAGTATCAGFRVTAGHGAV